MNLWYLLEETAGRYPDKTAAVCENSRISYGLLRKKSEAVAANLLKAGVRRQERIAVVMPTSIEYVVVLFAIVKAGAVGVPLNTDLSSAELAGLVDHAGISTLFYDQSTAERMSFSKGAVLRQVFLGAPRGGCIAFADLLETAGVRPDPCTADADDGSFLLYTSGTTAGPKGVLLTHRNHIYNAVNYSEAYAMKATDVELAPTPLFHASTLGRLFTYVRNGSTCVLCRKFSPEACFALIERERVTSITQAPTMYHMMMTCPDRDRRDTRSVRRVVTGASAMSPRQKQNLAGLFPDAECIDVYGLTEASPGVSFAGGGLFLQKPDSVGKPMRHVETAVMDEKGDFVPPGTQGEIVCRGPTIMKGYWNDPAGTDEALQNGWLHTGDMGRMDEEGFLYIVGRKKDIIITGGRNVAPGEAESVLMDHNDVADASVFGVVDDVWGETVAAAVVLKQGSRCRENELISFCRSRLAGYKCPRKVFFVDSLPRNAAGKVMKNILKQRYDTIRNHTGERL